MSTFFSIVMPTYNRAGLIEKSINSALNQEYKDIELIVVDDGSNDETGQIVQQIIEKNKHIPVSYYYKSNGERAAARNYGLTKAKGDYVVFFDSDDQLYPNHLSTAADFIKNMPGVEIFHLSYEIKNDQGKIISRKILLRSPIRKELISGNPLSCNGVFIKREVALSNRFIEDRRLSGVEDWELWLRLASIYPIYCVQEITSAIINHTNRSVLDTNKDKLIKRTEHLVEYVMQNKPVHEFYKNELYKLKSSCFSYVSLHLALTKKHRIQTIVYLVKAVAVMPSFIIHKRFFAIIKHLL